jgi:hypothetical protein
MGDIAPMKALQDYRDSLRQGVEEAVGAGVDADAWTQATLGTR